MAKVFVAQHNDSVVQQSVYVMGETFLPKTLSHGTMMVILMYQGFRKRTFSVIGFPDSVEYRKILHTCIKLIKIAIYFSNTISYSMNSHEN